MKPAEKDWVVLEVTHNPHDRFYPYRVVGRNLSAGGAEFRWLVPELRNPRYDLSNAVWTPDAKAYFETH